MHEDMSGAVETGHRNSAFVEDEKDRRRRSDNESGESISGCSTSTEEVKATSSWNNSIEFLLSCVAMSIGFGNIWRFPFTAYENGGGVFLIPYVIVLLLVGKPFYYLEMIMGQFSSSSSIKAWRLSPAFVGIGWAQCCSCVALMTYYTYLMALTLFFLVASFSAELPWAKCREEWGDRCVDSDRKMNTSANSMDALEGTHQGTNLFRLLVDDEHYSSSAELYFTKIVLQEKDNIDDGIGLPDWRLTLCLLGSWLPVLLVSFQGVRSSGKASYFLASFPYVVLISLLIRAVTLDGAAKGILYFVTPKWSKLLDPTIWYAAVTQCFFSLSVCFGVIITYSSHNDFKHNIYRDAMIVTSLDTVTSFIAGCTIFGILGNLAHEMGIADIDKVVKSGVGLAFVSYPDAIAKFTFLPQLFSVLFFVMMFVLGVGSTVGMVSGIATALKERLPNVEIWQIVFTVCSMGFAVSTVYVTPGGQFMLTLVDYYGTSFVVFILASFEITAGTWLYGIENLLNDVEFMLERKTTSYWRICWFLVTPLILITIFIYTVATLSPLTYGTKGFPTSAHAAGAVLLCFSIFQIPFWMTMEIVKNRRLPLLQNLKRSFQPTSEWGPREAKYRKAWLLFKQEKMKERSLRTQPKWLQLICILLRVKLK
ncbi:sodium-dependent nutrient amino acid transporter 1-like isoform X1 [Hylaeus anthracinus]|uniref:sodium-dependent nutrient amino acid transporter 1-like isoform X1 n=1 Tax=Hylaeus anthracinus TaxID=313031 RepID=UPI0023B9494D|nr:sodium-dependent nutrient amino acid transporter 1-like isoform X1 [Hylaeus anthracinus]